MVIKLPVKAERIPPFFLILLHLALIVLRFRTKTQTGAKAYGRELYVKPGVHRLFSRSAVICDQAELALRTCRLSSLSNTKFVFCSSRASLSPI
jgi:hypothetical protein